MGFIFSRLWKTLLSQPNVRILMIGLDAAGKTSILYHLKMSELVKTIPTIGFNVETLEYKNLNFTIWDIGGQNKIRLLWKYYFKKIDAIIFVVDSADRERIEEAKEELARILNSEELNQSILLVMANKQDLSCSLSPNDIASKFEMGQMKGRKWLVQGTSAITGQGLKEGLDWLANTLLKKK